jgi:hypothetical protein
VLMVILLISGVGLIPRSGRLSMSSSVKTEANCWLRMFAFVVVSWCRNPSRLSGATFVLSHLVDLMKLKSLCSLEWLYLHRTWS